MTCLLFFGYILRSPKLTRFRKNLDISKLDDLLEEFSYRNARRLVTVEAEHFAKVQEYENQVESTCSALLPSE